MKKKKPSLFFQDSLKPYAFLQHAETSKHYFYEELGHLLLLLWQRNTEAFLLPLKGAMKIGLLLLLLPDFGCQLRHYLRLKKCVLFVCKVQKLLLVFRWRKRTKRIIIVLSTTVKIYFIFDIPCVWVSIKKILGPKQNCKERRLPKVILHFCVSRVFVVSYSIMWSKAIFTARQINFVSSTQYCTHGCAPLGLSLPRLSKKNRIFWI